MIRSCLIFAALLFLVSGCVLMRSAFSQDQQDDAEEGKPARCDNYKQTEPAHRCHCGKAEHEDCSKPTPDVEMDKKCTTYCRTQNCHCLNHCQT